MRHPTLQAIVIGFIVLTIAFRLIELTRPKDKRLAWFRAGYFTDLAYWGFTPLVTRFVTGVAVAVAAAPIAYLLWGRIDRDLIMHGWGPAANLPLWAQAIGLLVAGDFIGYWTHRAFHRGLLWRFHAMHHSSRDLDWLSAVRLHPVNDALTRLASAVPLLLTGSADRIGEYRSASHASGDTGPCQYRLGLGAISVGDCVAAVSPLASHQ